MNKYRQRTRQNRCAKQPRSCQSREPTTKPSRAFLATFLSLNARPRLLISRRAISTLWLRFPNGKNNSKIPIFLHKFSYFFPPKLQPKKLWNFFIFLANFRLGSRRTVQPQRRRLPSKNPLRTLAARTDLKDEYTEVTTGVAERVMRTLNVEKREYPNEISHQIDLYP